MLHLKISAAAMVLAALALAPAPARALDSAAFNGERAEYEVSWSGINAGTAVLSAQPSGDGRSNFSARARTNSGVALLYPLDVVYESTVGPGFKSALFTTCGKEGWGERVDKRVEFDHSESVSRYYKNQKLRDTVKITPDVLDPMSVIYYFRSVPFPEPGGELAYRVDDGKRVADGKLRVLGREKVKTPAGEFATVKVEPEMKGVRGIFGKSPNAHMYVWFSDDERKLMVKMVSEVSVGSFTALLSKVENPRQAGVSAEPAPPAPAQ